MNIAKKILGNTTAQIIGKLVTAVIAMITLNILSRYFSISQMGNYGSIFEHLALFGAIADMGIYTLVLREMSKPSAYKDKIYSHGFTLRIVVTLVAMILAIGAGFLTPVFWGTPIPQGIIIAAIGTFFVLISGIASVVLQYNLQMRYYSYSLIGGKIIGFLGVLSITKWLIPIEQPESIYWIVAAGTIGSFFIFLFTFLFSERHISVRLHWKKEDLMAMLKTAIPFGIMMILITLYFRSGYLMLRYLLPSSEGDVCADMFCGDLEQGKYIIALRMMEVLLLFPVYFMNSMMPLLSKNIEEKSPKLPKIFSLSFLATFTIAVPMAVGGVMLARPLAGMLADEKYLSTAEYFGSDTGFLFLSASLLFAFLNSFSTFSLIALEKQIQVVKINAFAVVFNIGLNFLLIPQYGLLGAAIATLISEIIVWGIIEYELQKHVQFLFPFGQIIKVIVAGGIMGLLIYLLQHFSGISEESSYVLLLAFPLALFSYVGVLWVSRFFTDDMKKLIQKN